MWLGSLWDTSGVQPVVTAAAPMPKKPTDPGFCTYASVKVDDEVLPLIRAAAALSGDRSTQEFISDVCNEAASRILRREAIKRRPPPPRPRGKGRKPG